MDYASGVRVVDYVVDAVARLGVRHMFGVGGANIEDVYDAIYDSPVGITGVVAKHEFSAATMADGYARSTAGLGVVMATSGGGAFNLVAGLAEAYASRVPLLALVGQAPTTLEGRGAFQDSSGLAGSIPAIALFSTISRYCARVERPADIVDHLNHAVPAALQGGPAVLLLPKDIQQGRFTPDGPFQPPLMSHVHDRAGLDQVSQAVAASRLTGKIVIIAGNQVARNDARAELRRLAHALDASVGVAPDAKDVYAAEHRGFCGVAGSMGNAELVDAVRHAALCLLVGTRMPVTARAGLESALSAVPVASIGAEPPFVETTHALSSNLQVSLAELAAKFAGTGAEPTEHATPSTLTVPAASGPGLRYRDAVEAIATALPRGADLFADAGNTGSAVVHHLPIHSGGRFAVALGVGGMGYSFGAGIGSCFGRGRRTFIVAGDGAFFMHGMEIHTAVEHRIPVTFIVFNNNAHAMCVTREQLFYRNQYSFNKFRPAMLAEGMAAMFPTLPSWAAHSADELTNALAQANHTDGPSFISVDCDPDEIPPFVPFLTHPTIEESVR